MSAAGQKNSQYSIQFLAAAMFHSNSSRSSLARWSKTDRRSVTKGLPLQCSLAIDPRRISARATLEQIDALALGCKQIVILQSTQPLVLIFLQLGPFRSVIAAQRHPILSFLVQAGTSAFVLSK